jgi:ATP-dependent RNA helicase SUPV3L1/SUV3
VGRKPFAPDAALATSIGLAPDTAAKLMARLGFRGAPSEDGAPRWAWRGRPPRAEIRTAEARPDGAFAALAGWGAVDG